MHQGIKTAGALALILLAGCAPSPARTPWSSAAAMALHQPSWLHGSWSVRTRDNVKETATWEEFTVTEKWITSTTTSSSTKPDPDVPHGLFASTVGNWSVSEELLTLNATAQESTSEQVHRVEYVKYGQVLGFIQFELKGDVLVLTEQRPARTRTVELRRGKPQDVPETVIEAPAASPSPAAAATFAYTTPHLTFSLEPGWEKIDLLKNQGQWENFAHVLRTAAKVSIGTIAFERTTEDVDLETVKEAWVVNAGADVAEIKKVELLGLPAYFVRRNVTVPEGSTIIKKYLVAKDARVYSFALVHKKDELFASSLTKEFEAMVQSVQWTSPPQK